MVSTRLVSYFLQNNLITAAQFGFLTGRSTEEAVTHIVDSLYSLFDAGAHGVGVFIDLAKAFDSLDRSILCAKLKHYGVIGNALAWFESYLSRREQRVRFSGELSGSLRCNYGVPQGSILSAFLFVVYINDLVKCTDAVECELDVGCDVLLNGVKLKRVTEVRFLGVVLRDNLSFAGHIKCVANKVSK